MELRINGEPISTRDGITLHELCESLELVERKGIAVSVNDAVIPKLEWHGCPLRSNDEVLIISATQGG